MKTKEIPFIILFMAAMTLSCEKVQEAAQPEVLSGNPATSYITLSAGYDNPAVTKTALIGGDADDRNNVKFVAGDKLSVFDTGLNNCKFTMVGEPYSDGSADFAGTLIDTEPKYADRGPELFVLSPYQAGSTLRVYSIAYDFTVTIPQEQTAVAGSFDPYASFSVGKTEYVGGQEFGVSLKNACALLKFSVPDDREYKKMTVFANDATPIGGNVVIRLTRDGNIESVTSSETEDGTVSLVGDFEIGESYYVAVRPGVYADGITVNLYTCSEGDYALVNTKTTRNSATFECGQIANLGTLDRIEKWYGDGSETNPFLISDLDDLLALQSEFSDRDRVSRYDGCWFKQTADINCKGEPIMIGGCAATEAGDPYELLFGANYNGCNYCISNYTLKENYGPRNSKGVQENYYGLFYCLNGGAEGITIKNLVVQPSVGKVQIDERIHPHDRQVFGFLSATTRSVVTIENVTVGYPDASYTINVPAIENVSDRLVVLAGGLVGDVVGQSFLTIRNCCNYADITISSGFGESNGDFNNCVGGLVGHFNNSSTASLVIIDRCRNYGDISDGSYSGYVSSAGGFVGAAINEGAVLQITNCVNCGNVSSRNESGMQSGSSLLPIGYSYAGGIVGYYQKKTDDNPHAYVYNCLNKGDVHSAGDDAASGGIFGYCANETTQVAMCANTGNMSADGDVFLGGICGIGSSFEISSNYLYPKGVICRWLNQKISENEYLKYCSSSDDASGTGAKYSCERVDGFWGSSDDASECMNSYLDDASAYGLEQRTHWSSGSWKNNTVRWTGRASISLGDDALDLVF